MAIADHEHSQLNAVTEHEKPVFPFRVLVIAELNGTIIKEYRLRFLERHTMLLSIALALGFIPIDLTLSITTAYDIITTIRDPIRRFCMGGEKGLKNRIQHQAKRTC